MAAKRLKATEKRPTVRRSYKFRIYPNQEQARVLILQMETLCRLYNELLERKELIYALTEEQKAIVVTSELDDVEKQRIIDSIMANRSWNGLSKWVTARRKIDAKYGALNYGAEHAVLMRIKKAYEAFWSRFAKLRSQGMTVGEAFEEAGYPYARDHNRFNIVEFENYGHGNKFDGEKLYLQGVPGLVRVKLHRGHREPGDMSDRMLIDDGEAKIKRLSVTRELDRWFVVASCELQAFDVPRTRRPAIGIVLSDEDLIVTSIAGERTILPPNPLAENLERLRALNRDLSRKYEEAKRQGRDYRSQSWLKTKHAIAKLQAKIADRRRDYHYKVARAIFHHLGHGDIYFWKRDVSQMIREGKGLQKRRDKAQDESVVSTLASEPRRRQRRERKPDARTMIDVGIAQFLNILTNKATEYGCEVVPVELDEEPFIPLDPVKQAKLVLARGLAGRNGTAEPGQ